MGVLDRVAGENVNTYAINQNSLTNTANLNYLLTYTGNNFTITPATLTVTANALGKVYGASDLVLTYSASGFQFADIAGTVLSGALSRIAGENVAVYPINQHTLTANNNYTVVFTGANFGITPAPLTISANAASRVYGAANPVFTDTIIGYVNGENASTANLSGTAALSTTASNTTNVGSTTIITGVGTLVAGNYVFSNLVNGTLTINPAPLTLTASNASKTYGQTAILLPTAFTPVGLVNGETVVGVTEMSPGSVATASVLGGPYAIAITPGSATGTFNPSNYNINYVNGALAVTPAPLTLTANDAAKIYGQTALLLPTAFTPVGLVNGDAVVGVVETSPGTAVGASVAFYPITPSAATGSGTFSTSNYAISYINGNLTVNPASLIAPPVPLTASDASKAYGQAVTLSAFSLVGLVDSDNVGNITRMSLGTAATIVQTESLNVDQAVMPSVKLVVASPAVVLEEKPAEPQVETPLVILGTAPIETSIGAPDQALIMVPVKTPSKIYETPYRLRKQDRN